MFHFNTFYFIYEAALEDQSINSVVLKHYKKMW